MKTHAIPSVFSDPNAPLTVRVWTDKKQFSEGETIKLYVEGNRDFYARIVNLDANGDMIQLLPNQFRQSRFFKGKKVYVVPDDTQGDRFSIISTPPYGTDTIVTFASEAPLGEVNLTPVGQGLGPVSRIEEEIYRYGDARHEGGGQGYENAGWVLRIHLEVPDGSQKTIKAG